MFIYIVKNVTGFCDDPSDYEAKELRKRLLKTYGCEPVIIPVDINPETDEMGAVGNITPEQVLHITAQNLYNPKDKEPITYELTAVDYDEINFGKQGDIPTPYVFENGEEDNYSKNNSNNNTISGGQIITAYTDGSYNIKNNTAGYGAVIILENGKEEILSGRTTDSEMTAMRNVAGELQAVLESISYAEHVGAEKLVVYYDYEGIEKWVTGSWRAKNKFTQKYRDIVRNSSVKVEFNKVTAHTGIEYNEHADKLAKEACGM